MYGRFRKQGDPQRGTLILGDPHISLMPEGFSSAVEAKLSRPQTVSGYLNLRSSISPPSTPLPSNTSNALSKPPAGLALSLYVCFIFWRGGWVWVELGHNESGFLRIPETSFDQMKPQRGLGSKA